MTSEVMTLPEIDIDVSEEWTKPRLVTILFCESANLTNEGKANVWNIFDRIFVNDEKKQTGAFTVFVRTAQTWKGELRLTVVAPNNEAIAVLTYEATEPELAADRPTYVQFIGKLALKVEVDGIYWVDISYQGRSLGGSALALQFQKADVMGDANAI